MSTKSCDRLQEMADNVFMREDLVGIGDEWAPRVHTMRVIEDCIFPYVDDRSVVAEIGVGGGTSIRFIVPSRLNRSL